MVAKVPKEPATIVFPLGMATCSTGTLLTIYSAARLLTQKTAILIFIAVKTKILKHNIVEVEVTLRPRVSRQSVLVSGNHLGPATNFAFSLKFPSDSCGFVIL
jgi:hypothetical protein